MAKLNVIFAVFALAILLMITGCGNSQKAVIAGNAVTGAVIVNQADSSQNVFTSNADCEKEGFDCVPELKNARKTGNHLVIGEVAAGEQFEIGEDDSDKLDSVCSTGLSPVSYAKYSTEGCEYADCQCYSCVGYMDGKCGVGENACNSPQDCK